MHISLSKEIIPKIVVKILVLFLLAYLAFLINLVQFNDATGKDFYQYWMVGKVQSYRYSSHRSGNLYGDMARFDRIIKSITQCFTDLRLEKAIKATNWLVYQTPLCYLLFASFPSCYSISLGIFWSLSLSLFLVAIMLLSSVYQGNRFGYLVLALLLISFFAPLHANLDVGNLVCWQFWCLALSLWLTHRLLNHNTYTKLTTSAFLCLQVFLTLLKPILLPVSLLLGAHLWKRHGFRSLGPAMLASASFGAILIILPCLMFHSWTIWYDWFKCIGGISNHSIISWIHLGNFATVSILAKSFGIGIYAVMMAMAAGIAILMTIVLVLAMPADYRRLIGWGRTIGRALDDPDLCSSVGVIVMLLLSPLVWMHYYLLTLLPALWLISKSRWRLVNILGWLSIFLASNLPLRLLPIPSWRLWIADEYALSLAFLLVGVLAIIHTGEISSDSA